LHDLFRGGLDQLERHARVPYYGTGLAPGTHFEPRAIQAPKRPAVSAARVYT